MYKVRRNMLVAAFIATGIFFAKAQKGPEKNWNSARILHEIKKLKHVGRVLYIAAHPDDENTQLISYLSNDLGLETAYLSLTRGDGGQDLIGPEVREELGVIRTQELLMARSVDGGQQFFTRANDFGFSKTAAETFRIWDTTQVLSDIVWVIRKFKPDLIITRFSPTYTKTHGHHQASAILATEAFTAAADPKRFPEQLKYVNTWQADGLYWNTSTFFFNDNKFDTAGLYHTSIGTYLPLLGKSVGELAAESRSMHKSQGFGVAPRRGDIMEYFVYLAGKKPANRDIFSVADFNWDRIKGCEGISQEVDKTISNFNCNHPESSTEALISLYHKMTPHSSDYLVASKLNQLREIILQSAGIYNEALSTKEFVSVGDSINVSYNCLLQNNCSVKISNASLYINGNKSETFTSGTSLNCNEVKTFKVGALLPDSIRFTGPYWLEEPATVGMYKVDNQLLRGLPQNPTQISVRVTYHFELHFAKGTDTLTLKQDLPVFNKKVDPVKGELFSLARIVPPVVVTPDSRLMVFSDNNEIKELTIKIKSFAKCQAKIELDLPPKWGPYLGDKETMKNTDGAGMAYDSIKGSSFDVWKKLELKGNGEEIPMTFKIISPDDKTGIGTINVYVTVNGHVYNRSLEDINYDHIPKQVLLPKSEIKLEKIDIKTTNKLIGYISGAGDDIPDMLRQIGYKVEMIPAEQLATTNLQKYDAIISGVRAYNTVERLKYDNPRLLEYVKNGGNYIVQYNNSFRLETDNIGPYPLTLSADRTTEEDCKVTFVHPDNPVLNTPNKITAADFDGWVQERGLYYPNKWDSNYTPILEMADAGEKPTQGALLIAKYGKGNFVYTGLSFFRELPAGVTGAYRLFANLIELGKHEK